MDRFANVNNINIHFLEFAGGNPPVVLMHGLTANAHSFDGFIDAGLSPAHRVISIDLRGRGRSDKPPGGYTMNDHAKDIIGLLNYLGIDSCVMGGHSFGALLSIFIAAHHPERVSRLVLIDAAARLHPNVREMVAPSMSRLGKTWPSFENYLEKIKTAPYMVGHWHPQMKAYYRADVMDLEDGGVTTNSKLEQITEAINGALGLGERWIDHIKNVEQPAILINATGGYGPPGSPPILPEEFAMETVEMMKHCWYVKVPGNHLTMLFGQGAEAIVEAIRAFLAEKG